MTMEKSEKDHFIYVTYSRQGFKDVNHFRTAMAVLASDKTSEKDIVIDFGNTKYLTSPEIGSMVRLANGLVGSSRILRVIPCEGLYRQLSSLNLTKLDHFAVYQNRDDFAEQLKKMQ
jgi:hypothetical protein